MSSQKHGAWPRLLVLIVFLLAIPATCWAHRVNIFAYVEGKDVYTESYFADGSKVINGTVTAQDDKGQTIARGKTDTNGQFTFPLPAVEALTIEIDAGLGHKNTYLLKKSEM